MKSTLNLFLVFFFISFFSAKNGIAGNISSNASNSAKITVAGDEKWSKHFELPGINGLIQTLDNDGSHIFAGGSGISIPGLNIPTNVAMWDGDKWNMLGTSVGTASDPVLTINKLSSGLYAGNTTGVYKWSGTTWTNLGTIAGTIGNSLYVTDIDEDINGNLYVIGSFISINGITVNGIARWDGTSWHALGTGVDITSVATHPECLATIGSSVYIAGSFTSVSGVAANMVAKWNGFSWSAVGSGLSGTGLPQCMIAKGNDIYVGGYFSNAGSTVVNNIAKWNGTTWSAFGPGFDGTVNDIKFNGNDLYACGGFLNSGTTPMKNVARWNGTSWISVGDALNISTYAMTFSPAMSMVGGSSNILAHLDFNNVTLFKNNTWEVTSNGVDSTVECLYNDNGVIYAGGVFSRAGGLAASRIAKWNGTKWDSLNNDIVLGTVRAIEKIGSTFYVGGSNLVLRDSVVGHHLLKWDGTSWSMVGADVDYDVFALASYGNNLYIGGSFATAGGTTVNNITYWDGTSYHAMGSGTNNTVRTIKVDSGGNVYAGGNFTTCGGITVNRIAKWNGSSWSTMASGVNQFVTSIGVSPNNDIYIGGQFDIGVNGNLINHVAKWNGSAWVAMGQGLNISATAYSFAFDCNNVYIGGAFSKAGTDSIFNIAKWDGSTWTALGSGTGPKYPTGTGAVMTLVKNGNQLFTGGIFTSAGDKLSHKISVYNIEGTPEITFTPSVAYGCNGAPVTITANTSNVGTLPQYQWQVNGQTVSGSTNTLTLSSYNEGDQVTLTVITDPLCAQNFGSVSSTVTIHTATIAVPTIQSSGNTLTVTNPDPNATYVWQKETAGVWNDIVPLTTGTFFNTPIAGNYRVKSSIGGCEEFSSAQILTSINQLQFDGSIILSPVPAENYLNINLSNTTNKYQTIQLLTLTGELVSQSILINSNTEIKIPVSQLSSGMYMIRMTDTENRMWYQKFIKQ
jgi:trimeric autotransporter adhesin